MAKDYPPEVRKALMELLAYTLNNGIGGMRFLIPEVRYEDMELGDWVIEVRRASQAPKDETGSCNQMQVRLLSSDQAGDC